MINNDKIRSIKNRMISQMICITESHAAGCDNRIATVLSIKEAQLVCSNEISKIRRQSIEMIERLMAELEENI